MTENLPPAEIRLTQYREQSTWSNATHGSGVEKALHEIATGLKEEIDRLRSLLAPAQLAEWADQLQSADLTPHPAFAWCSTTSGYEAAVQVATTDRLTEAARERLLAELRVAFDETVRRVLGYRPAETGAGR